MCKIFESRLSSENRDRYKNQNKYKDYNYSLPIIQKKPQPQPSPPPTPNNIKKIIKKAALVIDAAMQPCTKNESIPHLNSFLSEEGNNIKVLSQDNECRVKCASFITDLIDPNMMIKGNRESEADDVFYQRQGIHHYHHYL
ncbi:hypothetical protein Glove_219g54 [Diversispora epigaea]|uniref:Uncharacterized protein n=1 Tax=Diversispora epigaea TaxID=1348612 RepID=A0A397IFT9_9GLOM|nr:hypothetical protein Glove_219g54 [Diversispora epigaea]